MDVLDCSLFLAEEGERERVTGQLCIFFTFYVYRVRKIGKWGPRLERFYCKLNWQDVIGCRCGLGWTLASVVHM